jgi:hypothetical protein
MVIDSLVVYLGFQIYRKKYASDFILEQLFFVSLSIALIFLFNVLLFWDLEVFLNELPFLFSLSVNLFLANFLVSILLLINIERSRSTYVIAWVGYGLVKYLPSSNSYNYSQKIIEIESNLKMLDQRISENLKRSIFILDENSITLSFRGKMLLRLSNFIALFFNLKGWLNNTFYYQRD